MAKIPDFGDYIVFVDESGSPTLQPLDPDYPIFVLVFCVVGKREGRLTHVIAESRGRVEDAWLELEFRRILDPNFNWGMAADFRIQETPFDLRFAEKKINSAGLQLADLTGHPIGRNYLKPDQPNHAFDVIRPKIYRKIWSFP